MKKNYSHPEMNIVVLCATQPILNGSITINSAGDSVDASKAAAREMPGLPIFEYE